MATAVTHKVEDSNSGMILHMALELSEKTWTVAFTTGLGQKPRLRRVASRDLEALESEIGKAKRRFGLATETAVVSCYEAGMDGFWVHRALVACGIENCVVDSSSIDTKRRGRHAKTDRLDAGALVNKLVQYRAGNKTVWSVVRVPPEGAEDERHNARELRRLGDEQTALRNTIKGLLKTQGIRIQRLSGDFAARVAELRRWDDTPLGCELQAQLGRLFERAAAGAPADGRSRATTHGVAAGHDERGQSGEATRETARAGRDIELAAGDRALRLARLQEPSPGRRPARAGVAALAEWQ
jgi:transposase